MLNRRQFIRSIALVSIGAAALPEQITALESIFDVNTPQVSTGLITIDEIYIGGVANVSSPTMFEFSKLKSPVLNLAMNLFGGVVRWVATPEGRIFTREEDLSCRIILPKIDREVTIGWTSHVAVTHEIQPFFGSILYTDQNLVRKLAKFNAPFSSIRTMEIVSLESLPKDESYNDAT